MSTRRVVPVLMIVALLVTLLGACGTTATPTVAPTQAPATKAATAAPTQVPPTKAPPTNTAVPPTPTAKAPTVGGSWIVAMTSEFTSLDPHNYPANVSYIGSALVSVGPDLKYYPYLADSWTISPDGLTWTFVLRKGVKFHDGTPLTAGDYAWTLNRAKTAKGVAASYLGTLNSASATDDQTLVLKLTRPAFPLMGNLTLDGFLQPLPKATVEKMGDVAFSRAPVGVGPFKFKEWKTGEKVVLERNPDFAWGPAWAKNKGAAYIQTIEYRVLPEYATQLAGLEAGEISLVDLQVKDLQRIKDSGKFSIYDYVIPGINPGVHINTSLAQFQDIRVRQALNYAVDRDTLVKVVALGNAVPMYGAMSSTVTGYAPEVEKLGYHYDVAKAKQLLKEAGYTAAANGMLEKDGKPFKIVLKCGPRADHNQVATILKEEYKAIGIDMEILQEEGGTIWSDGVTGKYELILMGLSSGDGDILFQLYASASVGATNIGQIKDPELDPLLQAQRSATDEAKRQEALTAAQRMIVEKAYAIPLYAGKSFRAYSSAFKNVVFMPFGYIYLFDAYFESE